MTGDRTSAPGAPYKLVVFPREEDPAAFIYNRLFDKDRGRDTNSAQSIERTLQMVQPLLQRLDALLDDSFVLTMPPLGPVR